MAPRTRVGFIEPMLLLRTDKLPDDPARWSYQLKLDGVMSDNSVEVGWRYAAR